MSEATVVTSENSAEFYAQKLSLVPEPAAAVEKPTEPVVESEQKPVEEKKEANGADKQDKSNPKIEKRFSELSEKRNAAEARAAEKEAEATREREARIAAEKKVTDLEAKLNPPKKESADAKPQASQFADAFEYAEALAEWSAEQALLNRDKQESERKAQADREKVVSTWKQRLEAAKTDLPDYDEMIASSDVAVSNEVRDAILDSDVGPKILYHLASNPEIAASLAAKSVPAALREIGKLEAKFSTPEAKPTETAKPAPKPSGAPAPINPLKGANASADAPITSDGVYHGTYAQWKADRKAGKIR